ncbi:KAP family P-loop NTPase fold protein [Pseudoteredinibacter isoporae]|uniref:KAP family P-loop NTPase fold protein n=1 Tax=Pseudoteredinibacter isoporae TaxID=570281 RepID=UPI00310AC3C2
MKLIPSPIQITDETGFSEDLDIFNRAPFGESLYQLINNTPGEMVIALDAPWGSGKSTFIRMWIGLLHKKNMQHIYFDAFKNDYKSDPFLAISSEIYELIEEQEGSDSERLNQFLEKSKSACLVMARAGVRMGLRALTAGIIDDTTFEDSGAEEESSAFADSFISDRLAKSKSEKKSIEDFKICLNAIAKEGNGEGNGRLVFIIDELDRCRPNYALEVLEIIKHFYSVDSITFVLVTNRRQLEKSIECEYGYGIEASEYLQKFVSIWTTLPRTIDDGKSIPGKYIVDCLKRMEFRLGNIEQDPIYTDLEELASGYQLSFRNLERVLTNFAIVYNSFDGGLSGNDAQVAFYISIVKVKFPKVYDKLAKNNISYMSLKEETRLDVLQPNFYWSRQTEIYSDIETHQLRAILRFNMFDNIGNQNSFASTHPKFDMRNVKMEKTSIGDICERIDLFRV